jgi:hypothetical protein
VSSHALAYTPPPSLLPFINSDKFASFVVGPYGSTKTTAGIMKIAMDAKRIAPSRDGVRRSRYVWVRNTVQMLRDTSIPDFLKWFPDGVAGTYFKTEGRYVMRFDDVECEVLFRGLDDSNDVRRLLALQLTGGIMDEFREIHPSIYESLAGRLGRFPDKLMVPPRPEWGVDEKGNPIGGCVNDAGRPHKRLWGMSNPPDYGTFWEELLNNPPDNVSVTFQPSGVSPEADWVHLLDSGYYENLMELHKHDQDWIDVYVHAKFGASLSGKPVFRAFDDAAHLAKEDLTPIQATPILIGADAGLTPAAVIAQVTHDGRVVVHNELTSEGMGALRFIREKLKPLLVAKFPTHRATVIIDPAAFQRVQTDERTVADIYKAEGFVVRPAKTNSIQARIAAVDQFLTRNVNGHSGLLINPKGCPILAQALKGKYRYKVNTKGETDERPEKSHPVSDLADSLQYVCLHADGGAMLGKTVVVSGRRPVQTVRAGGWT